MTRDRISKLETESIQLSQSLNNSKGRDWRKNEQSQRPMGQYQIVQHTYHWNPRRRGRRRRKEKGRTRGGEGGTGGNRGSMRGEEEEVREREDRLRGH